MYFTGKGMAVSCLALAAGAVVAGSQALAKPHHRHLAAHAARQAVVESWRIEDRDPRYPALDNAGAQGLQQGLHQGWQAQQPARAVKRVARRRVAPAVPAAAQASFASVGFGDLVSDARRYIGTNPTGRSSLWCGAFMDKVLRETGHAGGGNLASAYARYGTRISGPQIGAIAVMGRRGGGHVGVVSGIDASGNPIIISGNHNRTVAEAVYPRGRISAYVMPH